VQVAEAIEKDKHDGVAAEVCVDDEEGDLESVGVIASDI